jgi:hypothetical protein
MCFLAIPSTKMAGGLRSQRFRNPVAEPLRRRGGACFSPRRHVKFENPMYLLREMTVEEWQI